MVCNSLGAYTQTRVLTSRTISRNQACGLNQYSLIEQSLVLFLTAILEGIVSPGLSGFFELDPVKSDLFDQDNNIYVD